MSETTPVASVTEQSQTVTATPEDKVLSRLSAENGGGEELKTLTPQTTETVNQTPTTPTAEETQALADKAKELGLPENATKEEIEKAETVKNDTEWKVDEVIPTKEEELDGTWKGLIESFELGDIPADYSEEKGFEVVQNLFNQKLEAVKAEALNEAKYDRYVDVPEQIRGEAEMVVELMKAGQTLEQINEPFIELAQYKAMSKEELVRHNLMFRYKNDEEVVDNKMQKLIEDGLLDVEYKSAKFDLDNYEQSLNHQRQEQIKNYKNTQQQIQTQKFNQETAKLNHALDGVPEYLGKKLTPEVKAVLKNELASGKYHKMDGTPEEKVDYLLYKRFGKAGIQSFQARAQEKVVLQNKQQQHNVPIVQNGNVNRVEQETGKTPQELRLQQLLGG